MSLGRLLRTISNWRVVLPIYHRRLEVYLLYYWAVLTRSRDIELLMGTIGKAVYGRTPFFSGVYYATMKGIGYPTDRDGQRGPICWAVPVSFIVHINELPYFGLGIEFRGKSLCIRQMQGVGGAVPLCELKDWPELLAHACMLYAVQVKLKEVRIYKADQDLNFECPEIEPAPDRGEGTSLVERYIEAKKAHQQRMRRRYDRTASDLGFIKKKKFYVWKNPHYTRLF